MGNRLTRRSFLTASAAVAGAPALARAAPKKGSAPKEDRGPPDIVVVGAGAAGIAAARRIMAAGRRVAVLEAASQVGGRCITDMATFGVPLDRGARFLYQADVNPVARLARETGLSLYPAPPGQRVRIGRRYAREGEMEELLAGMVRASTAIAEATRRGDVASAQALPRDLGDWRPTIEFMLGPFGIGKDLAEISALDFASAPDRDNAALCRQGFGALLAKLAERLPVQLGAPVTRIEWYGRGPIEVDTARGRLLPRAVIVTASTNVLNAGKIRFIPDLPRRHADALARLRLGSTDRITLELPGNPLGLRDDELVFEKASSARTGAAFANIGGRALCSVDVAGNFGRELAAKGEPEMTKFALDWLGALFDIDLRKSVKRTHVTRWNNEPWVMGANSSASPNAQPSRRVLMEPLNNRIFLAGEAAHERLWGTVGGAWESGERAAEAALRALGFIRR